MVNRAARRPLLALLGLALGAAASARAQGRPLSAFVPGPAAVLRSTVLEVVYLGPTNKLFPSVALSGGADAFDAHVAFEAEFPREFPAVGARVASVIGPHELDRALASLSRFRGVRRDAVLGLFVIDLSTRRRAALLLDSAKGRRALTALIDSVRDASAQRDLLKLKGMIFPR